MKWLGLFSISAATFASVATAQANIRCQANLGGQCGDSSRIRESNCCYNGYCQPWNSGYYQCITAPAKCPTQETDIDYAGNDIKTVYGLQPSQCCDTCAATANCKAYTFVNQNPDGKTACYLKTSSAGRVEKKGAVSASVAVVTTSPPPTPSPPANCPLQESDVDYYGNDLSSINGISQSECCDACGNTLKCVAYSYVPSSKACYLKTSTAGKVSKSGVVSGQVKQPLTPSPTPPPSPPPNCPAQEIDVDYYGSDIKNIWGITQTQCCDECGKTDKCVAYTFVPKAADGRTVCYLKSSTVGRVKTVGVISGSYLFTRPPPPPPNCPVQEINIDYYGNDIKSLSGVTQAECCGECGRTAKCVAYTFIAASGDKKGTCYLKSSAAGKTTKTGAISGQILSEPPAPNVNCPAIEPNVDFYGNDIGAKYDVTQSACCDACAATSYCAGYTFIVGTGADGKGACYLKNSTAGRVTKTGAVSAKVANPLTTPPPTTPAPPANCPVQEKDIDYYGNDLKSLTNVSQNRCCDECGLTAYCLAYTYVPSTRTCYLKSSTGGYVAKAGVVSGKYSNPPLPSPKARSLRV